MAELAPPAPVAAPASESVVPPAAAPVVSVPATSPRPPLATAPAMTDDLAWLRSRQPSHFTLQLLGVRERAAIDQFIRVHRLKGKYAVFARDLNGKPWYSLVYGDYPDRDAALRGRAALPASLRGASVWPRTFASVWEQLPTAGQPR
jgi:DamX protein